MNVKSTLLSVLALAIFICGCNKSTNPPNPQDDQLKLNQIQIIASHNSYHKRDIDTVFNFLLQIKAQLTGAGYNPEELDYTHDSFNIQFDQYGVRGLELDIYNDPQGGLFYTRKVNTFAQINDTSFIPELLQPGFKMLHIKDVDYNSLYNTFKGGLQAIKDWSDHNPNHLPIFVNIETKEDGPSSNAQLRALGFGPPVPFDAAACDALDAEIKSVFGDNLDKLITPDKLRNGLPTLNDVVVQNKWPTLGKCRGKIIFIMEGTAVSYYVANHPSLQGRAVFTYAPKGAPEAAFLIMNDSKGQLDSIKARVREGYIVRTRSDAGTTEARTGDYSSMNAAFASGAQITSTDYYRPDPRGIVAGSGWTNFVVQFPNRELGRKNPINADTVHVDAALVE